MNSELLAAIQGYLLTLEEDGISIHERLSVWAVLADLLSLASVAPNDWPTVVLEATDTVAPLPAA